MDAVRVARRLSERLGRPVNVLDLSKKWLGNGVTYVMLRDLLKRRGARQIVVEFKTHRQPGQSAFLPNRPVADVLESGLAETDRAWPFRLQDMLETAVRKAIRQPTLRITGQRRTLKVPAVRP